MFRMLTALVLLAAAEPALAADRKPNVVVFYIDDMGYADHPSQHIMSVHH